MKTISKFMALAAASTPLLRVTFASQVLFAQATGERSSRPAFAQSLPLDVESLSVEIVEVDYGPGAASPVHTHPCPVIGYVLEGAVRTQVKVGAEAVYTAGQGFYESPNSLHLVSANVRRDQPAKFIAFFVCGHRAPQSKVVPGGSK